VEQVYACSRCGQLFWQGTHWRRIAAALKAIAEGQLEGNELNRS
jgi:uncharacterized protein with PIN domain